MKNRMLKKNNVKKTVLNQKNQNRKGILRFLFPVILGIFIVLVLGLSIRGLLGNPTSTDLNTSAWMDKGPLELSPERGRFALLYSFVEDKSLQFSVPIAKFASPDVAYLDGSYVSLFAPGVSFVVIPGFILGKLLGASQVGAFSVIALFALINTLLIRKIAMLLGIKGRFATISALIFLFATPAFAYSVTLYQHHISTFLLLFSIYLLLRFNNVWSLIGIWILCSASVVIDYPNLFILFPVGVYALGRIIATSSLKNNIQIEVNLPRILTLSAVIFPMLFFFWFNKASYHNPLQLSGTIERALEVKNDGTPVLERQKLEEEAKADPEAAAELATMQKSATGFFRTRNLLNGFYEHFFSEDRGMIYFTPVILLGFIGMFFALTADFAYAPLFTGVISATILLYSLWGDPYGGWAFGSRYLIPAYAILAIFIAYLLQRLRKSLLFLFVVLFLTVYSVSVNTVGALTSNSNPPKAEVLALEQQTHHEEKYTYMRNVDLLNQNISKSFVFQTFAKHNLSAWDYFAVVDSIILIPLAGGFIYLLIKRKELYVPNQ